MNVNNGKIEIICGPMFSGKTEELIRRLVRAQIAKKNVFIFKHSTDNRYSEDYIVSHNKNKIKCHAITNAKQIIKLTKSNAPMGGSHQNAWVEITREKGD